MTIFREAESFTVLYDITASACMHKLPATDEVFSTIMEQLELEPLFPFVSNENPSRDAPYHNALHERRMAAYAFMAGTFNGCSFREVRVIVAAACMHDFDHTAGEATDDSVNIERAVTGLYKAMYTVPELFETNEWEVVERLIRSTRYPHFAEPADILEASLRDADFSMPYISSPDREQLFHGLRQELAASGKVYTLEAFADGVVTFYQASTQHTAWAKAYAKAHNLDRKLIELRDNLRMAECKSLTEGG